MRLAYGIGNADFATFGSLLFPIILFVLFARRGQTAGKWMLGIKILKNDGSPARFGSMLVRESLGKAVSTMFFGSEMCKPIAELLE